jgi:predicted DNA-binding transcriptional regulator AlpA
MLQTIKKLLLGIVDDIDAGNSNIDENEAMEVIRLLKGMRNDNPMSKYQAYTYLGISRATFDNLVREGKLPEGRKLPGFKEKIWLKKDLRLK